MPKLSSIQQFGDNFLKVIENERDRKQRRNEFNNEMAFRNRQLNFLNNYRQGILADQRTQAELSQNQFEADLSSQFPQTQKGSAGAQLGSELNRKFGTDIFGAENFFSDIIPQTPKPITQAELIKEGGATLERKFTTDPISGEEITTDFSSVISPDRSGGGGDAKIQARVNKLKGDIQGGLTALRKSSELGVEGKDRIELQRSTQANVVELLEISGLPFNGETMTKIRSAIKDDDDLEKRRKILNEAIFDEDFRGKLTEEQIEVLKLWIEVGTR